MGSLLVLSFIPLSECCWVPAVLLSWELWGCFWGERYVRAKGESRCPNQSPPSLLLLPLPVLAEAPVSGPLDTRMCPCLELAAPLHPRRRGHSPGALAGPPEPGPRAGREVTRGDKASACLGTGAGCCLPLLCSSHGARQGRALSAGSGIPHRPDNSRSPAPSGGTGAL